MTQRQEIQKFLHNAGSARTAAQVQIAFPSYPLPSIRRCLQELEKAGLVEGAQTADLNSGIEYCSI
jgi:hypothetical protein